MALNDSNGQCSIGAVQINPFAVLDGAERDRACREVDRIFFEASSVQSFSDDEHRAAFWWLWLGRYLHEEPEHAFVAQNEESTVFGYLVGSLRDPAPRSEFGELSYFGSFSDQTAQFPAHLHINVASEMRGRKVGEQLVRAFEAHAARQASRGMHVVTGEGMRNVGFYERLGFREVARAKRASSHVVMLAKAIKGASPSGTEK